MVLVAVVLSTAAAGAGAAPGPVAPPPNPVYPGDYPDPFVLTDGRISYAYATNAAGTNVQVLASADLATWVLRREALPSLPPWGRPGLTWAPSVLPRFGHWVLYYTLTHRASGLQCISAAVGRRPDGPFADASTAPLVCQATRGGSIDPSPFVDTDGRATLLWKSEGTLAGEPTRIWARPLAPAGTSFGPTAAVELLRTTEAWEGPIIEGPTMARAAGGRLFLAYSANRWQTGRYAMGLAECAGPLGPCTKQRSPWVTSNARAAGPGGGELFRAADGTLRLAYHAWAPGRVGYAGGGVRTFRIDRVVRRGASIGVAGPT